MATSNRCQDPSPAVIVDEAWRTGSLGRDRARTSNRRSMTSTPRSVVSAAPKCRSRTPHWNGPPYRNRRRSSLRRGSSSAHMTDFVMPSLGADMEAASWSSGGSRPATPVSRGHRRGGRYHQGAIEVEMLDDGIVDEICVPPGRDRAGGHRAGTTDRQGSRAGVAIASTGRGHTPHAGGADGIRPAPIRRTRATAHYPYGPTAGCRARHGRDWPARHWRRRCDLPRRYRASRTERPAEVHHAGLGPARCALPSPPP